MRAEVDGTSTRWKHTLRASLAPPSGPFPEAHRQDPLTSAGNPYNIVYRLQALAFAVKPIWQSGVGEKGKGDWLGFQVGGRGSCPDGRP
jgi:hypothetical protein